MEVSEPVRKLISKQTLFIYMFIKWPLCVNNGPTTWYVKGILISAFNCANVFHNNQ